MDKKLKSLLAQTIAHIQKTNELLTSVLQYIDTIDETPLQQTEPPVKLKEVYTVAEAADLLGYSRGSLYKLINRRQITCCKPSGHKVFLRKADIEDFLSSGEIASSKRLQSLANMILNRPKR